MIASKVFKISFSGVNDPAEPKMKSRIPPTFFGLKLRYGMGIFPYEIVLRNIPFKKVVGQNDYLKFKRGHMNFSVGNDLAEFRILSSF
jgi:hypothetical protein